MIKGKRVLIIGIGNPILGDDAVGLEVAKRLKERVGDRADVIELSAGGLAVVEAMHGYEKAVIVDAVCIEGVEPGKILRYTLDEIKKLPRYFLGFHDVDPVTSIELAKSLSESFPPEIVFYGITIKRPSTYKEGMSRKVRYIISKCISMIEKEID